MINIDPYALNLAICHGQLAYPHEACGLLIGRQTCFDHCILSIIPTPNSWHQFGHNLPLASGSLCDRFAIDPLILLQQHQRLTRENLKIVGIYHSHPGGQPIPSIYDQQLAWPNYSYLIMAIVPGIKPVPVKSWRLNQNDIFIEEPLVLSSAN